MNDDFIYVDSQDKFDDFMTQVQCHNGLGLDLEFDKNRFAYGFNLSMIQIYDGNEIYLIDALAEIDLDPIYQVFEDDNILKIVFAFGEDIRLLHSLGCFPKNIYDLDISTKLLDFQPGSLSRLCTDLLGLDEAPSSQKSNWLKRPLSQKQLSYAAEDVRHLFALQRLLDTQVTEKGINLWVQEENSKYESQDFSEVASFSPLKNKDKKGLSEYQFYVLEQLMAFREEMARKTNTPGYHIISKETLIQLANGELVLSAMLNNRRVSGKFKSGQAKTALHEILSNGKAKAEKLGLSMTSPAIRRLSPEEYKLSQEKKRRHDKIVSLVLHPIKEEIVSAWGEHTSSFIFSNKIQQEITRDGLSHLLPYKQKLVWEISSKLKLDLSLLTES